MNRTLRAKNLKLVLRVESGLNVGEIYPLQHSRNVIGRRVDATVPVDDARISRNHAAIDVQCGLHYLVDLGSTNGTYLNGRRIQGAAPVSVGDEVRVGSLAFRIALLDQVRVQVGKTWKEPTRAVLRAQAVAIADEMPPANDVAEPVEERWRNLVPGVGEGRLPVAARRWLTFGACGLLVLAAIVTSLSH